MTWTCPKCKKPNLMEDYYCTRCGTSRPAGLHHIKVDRYNYTPKIKLFFKR